MILVRNLRLDIGQSSDRLKTKAARELKLPTWAIKDVKITKRSLDARRKNDIHWLYSVAVSVDNEEKLLAKCKSKNVAAYEAPEYTVPQGKRRNSSRRCRLRAGRNVRGACSEHGRAKACCARARRRCRSTRKKVEACTDCP